MPAKWVDYKEIREKIDFETVLKDYGVELQVKGEQLQGFCPLPGHKGQKRSPSFSVNIKKKIWQCFGCGSKGNVIDFVAKMENLNPENKDDFRKAALLLQNRYLPDQQKEHTQLDEKPATQNQDQRPHIVNQSLDFVLKGLDQNHPYLEQRGMSKETVECFGLGYCKQGLMKGRIAIPLHDSAGKLIGYAGRIIDDKEINENTPKYMFPGMREKDGKVYEFSKSLFLYNGFKIVSPVDSLIVVEGFFGLYHLWQAGYKNVVALMGSVCSEKQAELITALLQPAGKLWIMPDGDEAGQRCAQSLLALCSPNRLVRWIKLTDGRQPDQCSFEMLKSVLG